jgi:hypothetical protein
MSAYFRLPGEFIKFWYVDGLLGLSHFFASVNSAFFQLFSLGLLFRTFFRPLKNEYREGLVGFSIGMGMFVKSVIIIVDLLLFAVLLAFELLVLSVFLLLPVITLLILFI